MGAPIARQFYRLYPKKSLALVFVDGALRPTASKENMERFIAPLRGSNYQALISGMADGMLGRQMPEKMREEIKFAMLSTPQYVTVSAAEGMTDQSLWREDKIDVPVLAVFARSPVWKPDNESFYRSLAPNLEYQMWDGTGHFLMAEKTQEFNKTLAAFLAKIGFLKK
jgi:pimeloyl-ACP methyl ester carboxylesterase